jgi:3-methyl-2-oxobutanoate hydroxymethyltransferase
MSAQISTKRVTAADLLKMKRQGEHIPVLTAYDASFAAVCDAAGIPAIIVGDSLGMVIQGHDSTLPVRLEDVAYHVAAVKRGCGRPLIIADMPFGTFQESKELAYRHAVQLMAAGAQMVKVEGGREVLEATRFLVDRGIPVCGHVGLTPQHVNVLGGFKVQGRDPAARERLIEESVALAKAGAALLVLEAMPEEVGTAITQAIEIPTIGIGAGRDCDGQVLVLQDLLGISAGKPAKFVRNFMLGAPSIQAAIEAFGQAVREGSYPAPEHCY